MGASDKNSVGRSELSFIFAIILGLALGTMIKRIRIGLLIGIGLGLFIVITGWLRGTRK